MKIIIKIIKKLCGFATLRLCDWCLEAVERRPQRVAEHGVVGTFLGQTHHAYAVVVALAGFEIGEAYAVV